MHETFRLKKSVKYQGMAFSAIFLAVVVAYGSVFFLKEPAKHGFNGKYSVAIAGGMGLVIFGTMLLLSLYVWAAYYVERITIKGTTLWVRSMLQDRQFDVSELRCLKWRAQPPGGSIHFHVLGSKTRVDFYGYAGDDRLQIIRALRDLVPLEMQEGWPAFCHKVALPLRDGEPQLEYEPTAMLCTITRGRYDRQLVRGVPVMIAVATVLWAWLNAWQFFVLPFVFLAGELLLRFNVPPAGRREPTVTSTPQGRGVLLAYGAGTGAMLLMIGLPLIGVGKTIAMVTAYVLIGTVFPPLIYSVLTADKRRRAAEAEAVQLAPTLWQQGEGTKTE
jgi:hypothetical protein